MSASPDRQITQGNVARSPTVLLMVDFVNKLDFVGAECLRGPALEAARTAVRLKRQLRAKGVQAVYANDHYGDWHTDFRALWQRCSKLPGTAGQMARALKPLASDYTVLKPRHSAFYATPLHLLLEQMGCRQVVITGLATDSCVLYTAMDAYLRGLSVWVPTDCTAAESPQAKVQALETMRRTLKARVSPAFGSPAARRAAG